MVSVIIIVTLPDQMQDEVKFLKVYECRVYETKE